MWAEVGAVAAGHERGVARHVGGPAQPMSRGVVDVSLALHRDQVRNLRGVIGAAVETGKYARRDAAEEVLALFLGHRLDPVVNVVRDPWNSELSPVPHGRRITCQQGSDSLGYELSH